MILVIFIKATAMIQAALMFKILFLFIPFSFVEAACTGTCVRPTFDTTFKHVFRNSQIRRGFLGCFLQNSPPLVWSKAIDIDRGHLPQSKEKYDGTLNFMCRRQDGHFSLVEIQSAHNFYPADPLMIYAANFYNAQACKKNPKRIKAITRIGILNEKPGERLRKFSFSMDGIEFQEFCIMDASPSRLTVAQQDWQEFFKSGPDTSESWVKAEIKTPIVRKAFDMMRFHKLPEKVKREYRIEYKAYQPYWNIFK